MPVIGFPNCKSPKHYLVKATLPILNEIGRCEPCGKQTCLVRDSISTATTFRAEAYQETFKHSGWSLKLRLRKRSLSIKM